MCRCAGTDTLTIKMILSSPQVGEKSKGKQGAAFQGDCCVTPARQQNEGDYARQPFWRLPDPVQAGETQDGDSRCTPMLAKTGIDIRTFERSITVLRYQAGEVAESALDRENITNLKRGL